MGWGGYTGPREPAGAAPARGAAWGGGGRLLIASLVLGLLAAKVCSVLKSV